MSNFRAFLPCLQCVGKQWSLVSFLLVITPFFLLFLPINPHLQAKMVQQLGKDPSTRLLKHVVRCYLRLSDNLRYHQLLSLMIKLNVSFSRAREALRACLPEQLKDSTFALTLKDDSTTKKWLSQLLQNLGIDSQATTTTSGGNTVATSTAVTL